MVCAWMGNTPTVAHEHYLTVTDHHFGAAVEQTGDKLGMQMPVSSRNESQLKNQKSQKALEVGSFSEVVALLESALVAEEGFEPPTRGL